MKINPGRLKLELFCKGMRINQGVSPGKVRKTQRTRGGLGSGIDIILPCNVWVNTPVDESFAVKSPYELKEENNRFFLYKNNEKITSVKFPSIPKFYNKITSDGVPMSKIGIIQGGYLAFYIGPKCGFWNDNQNCKFCSTGLNVGETELENKSVKQVLEVAHAAFKEGVAEFIHINTGYQPDESSGIRMLAPYIKSLKKEIKSLIAIQTLPPQKNRWIDYAYSIGVDSVSFAFELWDRNIFEEICPGKSKIITIERFLKSMEYAVKVFPNGSVAGEIIVGLEPIESTLKAIDHITSVGALPIVCVFRPLKGAALENALPPYPSKVAAIFDYIYKKCKQCGIRINLIDKVSLVLMPIEGRFFSETNLCIQDYLEFSFFRTKVGKQFYNMLGMLRRRIKQKKIIFEKYH